MECHSLNLKKKNRPSLGGWVFFSLATTQNKNSCKMTVESK